MGYGYLITGTGSPEEAIRDLVFRELEVAANGVSSVRFELLGHLGSS